MHGASTQFDAPSSFTHLVDDSGGKLREPRKDPVKIRPGAVKLVIDLMSNDVGDGRGEPNRLVNKNGKGSRGDKEGEVRR